METTMRKDGLAKPILIALALAVALGAVGAEARVQEALYLVHYADPAGKGLSDVGRERAKGLSRMLMDAGIDVIYSAGVSRAVQTAEPTAKALNMKINILPLRNTGAKIDDLLTEHAKDRVFIALTLPELQYILRSLGLPDEEVYSGRKDHLYIIIPRLPQEPLVIKMRW